MINSVKTSKGTFVFIEVPKGMDNKEWFLEYLKMTYPDLYILSPTFLCTTDTITEDIAKEIVGKVGNGHYQDYNGLADYCVFALKSFKSLLQKLNLSPDKTYAICMKID